MTQPKRSTSPAPRRIVRADGTMLAEPSATDCHREFTRLAAEHPSEIIAADWLGPKGWTRWLSSAPKE